MDKLVERLQKEGRLRKMPAGFTQVEALLREVTLDLQEAKKTFEIAERATYLMAYNAMLKAGRALLLLNGWAPADGAQHKTNNNAKRLAKRKTHNRHENHPRLDLRAVQDN